MSVTTVIPVHNGMPFLVAAVSSILDQTTPGRLLLIDDGSTDGSGTYLDSLDESGVTVVHQQNAGLAATLNRAYTRLVETEFVARLDQDDLARPDRLARQLDLLRGDPNAVAVFTSTTKIGANGRTFGVYPSGDGRTLIYEPNPMLSLYPSTMMARTGRLRSLGGHRPEFYPSDDYDLLLRMSERHRVLLLHDPLVSYRVHRGASTWETWSRMNLISAFAWEMHLCRVAGDSETTFEAWIEAQPRGVGDWRRQVECFGRLCFRRAGMDAGEGSRALAACWLAPALALSPRYTLRGLRRAVRSKARASGG